MSKDSARAPGAQIINLAAWKASRAPAEPKPMSRVGALFWQVADQIEALNATFEDLKAVCIEDLQHG